MYAVIETGGKQYRVELGSELAVERLEGAPGDTVSFERVLLVADGDAAQIGTPVVADAQVTASVVRQDRADKVIVFKYRPKARHRTKKGHRQEQTILRVSDIVFKGRSAAAEAGAVEKEESKARKKAADEAQTKATADQALVAKLEQETAKREAAAKPEVAPAAKKASATKAPAAKAKATKATPSKAKAAAAPKAAAKPAAKAAAKPAVKATAKPATKSATKPAAKPAAKPRTSTKKDK